MSSSISPEDKGYFGGAALRPGRVALGRAEARRVLQFRRADNSGKGSDRLWPRGLFSSSNIHQEAVRDDDDEAIVLRAACAPGGRWREGEEGASANRAAWPSQMHELASEEDKKGRP